VPTVDSFMIMKKIAQDMRPIKRAADEGAVEAGRGAGWLMKWPTTRR
jgi:hypothetical protein